MQTAGKLLEDGSSGMTNKVALAADGTSDAKIFLKMLGSPAFSKTLALLRSSPLERDLALVALWGMTPQEQFSSPTRRTSV